MIDEVVNYCHGKYQNRENICANCNNPICLNSNCEQCLKDIHFKPDCHRSYDCPNMCYYYVCQNIYKYTTEMAWIWRDLLMYFFGEGKLFQRLDICSIGCGPCSELIALEEYRLHKAVSIPYSFVGFDMECTWNELQNVVKSNSNNPDTVSFEHTDAFAYYKTHNKPNVIVLNYMLSNLLKNDSDHFRLFLNNLCTLFNELSQGALIVNDINIGLTKSQVRYYFQDIIDRTKTGNVSTWKFYFDDSKKSCFQYGEKRRFNNIAFKVPDIISVQYHTNTECHSAQLLIIKNEL